MRPMLGGKAIEGRQDFFIFLQAFANFWDFDLVTGDELIVGCQSCFSGRRQGKCCNFIAFPLLKRFSYASESSSLQCICGRRWALLPFLVGFGSSQARRLIIAPSQNPAGDRFVIRGFETFRYTANGLRQSSGKRMLRARAEFVFLAALVPERWWV